MSRQSAAMNPPFNTQCLQNSAVSGERSVLTLGSFCLPCCMRNTAGICKNTNLGFFLAFWLRYTYIEKEREYTVKTFHS